MKKVAVIGFGFMGVVHSQNILKCADLQLVAIIEKNAEVVAKRLSSPDENFSLDSKEAETLATLPVYTSLQECLLKHELDGVHVCVHTDLHYSLVKEALNCGLHVLVEKPFVLDVAKGEELIELANKKKLRLMVAHVVRFMSPYKKLRRWVDKKEFGELKFLSLSRVSGVPNWGQWNDKAFGSTGGALFDLVIHDIDFAAFLLGRPDEIRSSILPGKLSKHDFITANWKYSNGVEVRIEGGNIFHSRFPFRAEFVAVFENATVSFSTIDGEKIFVDTDKQRKEFPANELGDGYFNEISLFEESLESGELPVEYCAESALETIRLCIEHSEA